jgi:hypothetical protein
MSEKENFGIGLMFTIYIKLYLATQYPPLAGELKGVVLFKIRFQFFACKLQIGLNNRFYLS